MEESMTEERIEEENCHGAESSGGDSEGSASEADASGGDSKGSSSKRSFFGTDSEEWGTKGVPGGEDCRKSILELIADTFPGKHQDIRSYSALALAYIGDVVYDLVIRTMVVSQANRPVNDLHRITVRYVSANAQSKIVQALLDSLTEEEQTVYRRGKNAKPHTTAKNASLSDYLKATGFEAVLGYLYLTDQMERLLYLVKTGISLAGL